MKLTIINENVLSTKIRDWLNSTNFFGKQILGSQTNYQPSSGFDIGNRSALPISNPTGIPFKPRHRQFFGLSSRPYYLGL